MDALDTKRKPSLASDTVLVAGFSLFGYVVAFAYESGFVSTFGIPASLISVDITVVFITCALMLSLASFWFILANFGYVLLLGKQPALRSACIRCVCFGSLGFIPAWLYWSVWQWWLVGAIVLAVFAFLEFVFPRLRYRSTTYEKALQAQRQDDQKVDLLVDLIARSVGRRVVLLASCGLMACVIAFVVGNAQSLKQSVFPIVAQPQDMAVLRVYGSTMICAPLHREARTVERRLVLLQLTQMPCVELRMEEVGPLRLEEQAKGESGDRSVR